MTADAHADIPMIRPMQRLDPAKFRDPQLTARGERRASVALTALDTLWFNTGTLCNLECQGCYIESSPTNDRLEWLRHADVARFLDEAAQDRLPLRLVGFTGGEPFMNPEFLPMLGEVLDRGLSVLVLTNAMRPMAKCLEPLRELHARHGGRLAIRVSLDHYRRDGHEAVRGPRSWEPAIEGLGWLAASGFPLSLAARMPAGEDASTVRVGFARLFAAERLPIDATDPAALVLFPEMDVRVDVPEITEACWGILGKSPDSMMCASARMVIRRKGATPRVVACTLLPNDPRFDLGATLAEASGEVALNHPHCAKFCVLGGAACSR